MIKTLTQITESDAYELLRGVRLPYGVDSENVLLEYDYSFYAEVLGKQEYNGASWMGCHIGGDWQFPVYAAIFVNRHNNLEAYIPRNGNAINPNTQEAFGNDLEEDATFLSYYYHKKLTPIDIEDNDYPHELIDEAELRRDVSKHINSVVNNQKGE